MWSPLVLLLAVAMAAPAQPPAKLKPRQEFFVDFSCPGPVPAVKQFGVCCDIFTDLAANSALTGLGVNCTRAHTTAPGFYSCVNHPANSRGCCNMQVVNTTNYAACSPALPYGQNGTLTGGTII